MAAREIPKLQSIMIRVLIKASKMEMIKHLDRLTAAEHPDPGALSKKRFGVIPKIDTSDNAVGAP